MARHVHLILVVRDVSKVLFAIIERISIYMVHLRPGTRRKNKIMEVYP